MWENLGVNVANVRFLPFGPIYKGIFDCFEVLRTDLRAYA